MVDAESVVKKALKDSYFKRNTSVCSLPIQTMQVPAKIIPHDIILKGMEFLKIHHF
jgi:hypothetical protein